MALALHAIEQGVYTHVGQRVIAAPLGVEVSHIVGNVGEGVIDLVVEAGDWVVAEVLEGDAGRLAERHLPVAVEATGGIDGDGERGDIAALAPAVAEEVAQRRFDRGGIFAVPVDAQHEGAPAGGEHGTPDMLDGAGAVDGGERDGGARGDGDRGRHLPAQSELAGGARAGALGGLCAAALCAVEVFGADRARLRPRQARQVAQTHAEPVEIRHAILLRKC